MQFSKPFLRRSLPHPQFSPPSQFQVEVVLRQSAERVSSSAEVYGAVQQEARISRAIEIMLLHVDNLKRIYEREHSQLEEAKR